MIELLAVVAIIGILSALILSAVSSAKRTAQRAACRTVIRAYTMEFSE